MDSIKQADFFYLVESCNQTTDHHHHHHHLLQRLLNLNHLLNPPSNFPLHLLLRLLIRPSRPQLLLGPLNPRQPRRRQTHRILGIRNARLGDTLRPGSNLMQSQRLIRVPLLPQPIDVGNGAREDVCKRGDAACRAGCETADEEVGLSAKGGKGGGWEGGGETGDFADLGTSEFGADNVLFFFQQFSYGLVLPPKKKTDKKRKRKKKHTSHLPFNSTITSESTSTPLHTPGKL